MPRGTVAEKSRVCRSARHELHDLAHLHREAHVEHAVGLVEHQDLDSVEAQGAAAQVVEDAARGAHHDVGAGPDALRAGGPSSRRRRWISTLIPLPRPSSLSSSATWMASSRVGARTSGLDGLLGRGRSSRRWECRRPRSCPVPVRDCTTRSLPARARGMASAWTSVGALYPLASRLARVWAERPREAKLCVRGRRFP